MPSDNFNRANNASLAVGQPGGNSWNGGFGVDSNSAYCNNSSNSTGAGWNDGNAGISADHYSEATVVAMSDTPYVGLAVRAADANNLVGFYSNTTDASYLFTFTAASWVQLDTGAVFGVGDTIRLEAEGTAVRAYVNDVLTLSGTNTVQSGGFPGLCSEGTGTASRVDDWEGEPLSAGGGSSGIEIIQNYYTLLQGSG